MATNPLIALQSRGVSAAQSYDQYDRALQNRRLDSAETRAQERHESTLATERFNRLEAAEKAKFESALPNALTVQGHIEQGDAVGAAQALEAWKRSLPPGTDSRGVDNAMTLLERGGLTALEQHISPIIRTGALLGKVTVPQEEEYTLGPNAVRVRGREIIAENPRESSPVVEVNTGETQTAADKAFGGGIGDRANERIGAAQTASNQNAAFDRMLAAIQAGAETGMGEETLLDIKSLAATFGVGNITREDGEQEVIRKLSNELALSLRNPNSTIGGLPGSTSNKDLDFLRASVPGLQRTEVGNMMIIDFSKRVNDMVTAVAQEQGRIIAENGGAVPINLDAQISQFVSNYEILTDNERALVESAQARINDQPKPIIRFSDLVSQ